MVEPLSGVRLALPRREIDALPIEEEVAKAFAADLEMLRDSGVQLIEVELPSLRQLANANFVLFPLSGTLCTPMT